MARHRPVAALATLLVAAGGISLLLTTATACSTAPVTPDEPQRVSADTSGRATANTAGRRAEATGPDSESDDTHRWIYATNSSGHDEASEAADDEDTTGAQTSEDTDNSTETARVHLILQTDGTIQSTTGAFDAAEPAARHATDTLERQTSSSDPTSGTVTLHVASDAPTDALNNLVTELRTAGAPHISLTFAPNGESDADTSSPDSQPTETNSAPNSN